MTEIKYQSAFFLPRPISFFPLQLKCDEEIIFLFSLNQYYLQRYKILIFRAWRTIILFLDNHKYNINLIIN